MRVFILGVNGFIGHSLTNKILQSTEWSISGMDLEQDRIAQHICNPKFFFRQGDISQETDWIDAEIAQSDVVIPLAAVANPMIYIQKPIEVYEAVFAKNMHIIRQCVKHQKRIIFPSTSEVYGLCDDKEFDEENSPLVMGPISKTRWIYATSKQLLDRLIWAYGMEEGLRFTIFRPFNWIGPNLDRLHAKSARVVTQFIGNLLSGQAIQLVDGGYQSRTFTYISDGVDALMKILENPNGNADGKIFNVGNPRNECSIADLAYKIATIISRYPGYEDILDKGLIEPVKSDLFYGQGYQDVQRRVPSIARLRDSLGWEPKVDLYEALEKTIDFYLPTNIPPTKILSTNILSTNI